MGLSGWLAAGVVPGIHRHPLKKIAPDPELLLQLLRRWKQQAEQSGKRITRITVAYEAEASRMEKLREASIDKRQAMVQLLCQVVGVGMETADMLVHEIFSRTLRDRSAVARYAGLTGAPMRVVKSDANAVSPKPARPRTSWHDPTRLGFSRASER
jgi:hypothetical protein